MVVHLSLLLSKKKKLQELIFGVLAVVEAWVEPVVLNAGQTMAGRS